MTLFWVSEMVPLKVRFHFNLRVPNLVSKGGGKEQGHFSLQEAAWQ
jgi:hypothetical protein